MCLYSAGAAGGSALAVVVVAIARWMTVAIMAIAAMTMVMRIGPCAVMTVARIAVTVIVVEMIKAPIANTGSGRASNIAATAGN